MNTQQPTLNNLTSERPARALESLELSSPLDLRPALDPLFQEVGP